MIKTKKQMFIVIGLFTLVLFIGGVTYAWFTYRGETKESNLVAGDIYLTMTEGQETLTLTNVFPETKEEARAKDDNYITFSLDGLNTSNKTIYYEILLSHGDDKASPKSRYLDSELVFDLVELDANGNEVKYVVNAKSYDTLSNTKIWVDTIDAETDENVSRKYKLRAWVSEDVIISDSEPNANYTTTEFPNKYATVKVAVNGDFRKKLNGYHKVLRAIEAKKIATTNSCNPVWEDPEDNVKYFSGDNNCVDMNYVWYSGKLWRITAIYPDGSMKLVTQNNITSIAFNESGQAEFYTNENTTSYAYQWLNEDFYDTLYNAENIIDKNKRWNATMPADTNISTKPAQTNMVTANVGLLNNYEYYNSYRCVGITNDDTCHGTSYNTGYLNINYRWWLLNPYAVSHVWLVLNDGNSSYENTTNAFGVRPSIYLKSNLEFTGLGTISSPYRIVGDKDIGGSNEGINTRLSGEYVLLSNGNNEQLFRIIGVENNKTKIIAMNYADNNAIKIFATNSNDVLWGSGTTTEEGTWYTYLNASNTGYFDTLKSTYGELFDTGTYYLGISGNNYKLSVCANTTSGNTKVCEKTSDSEIFNIGIPYYGEMFATQQSGGSSNSAAMWLINRKGTKIWIVFYRSDAHSEVATKQYRARPTLHLKSTVVIKSGSGTEDDPYVVGLPDNS